jgi:fucose permease
MEGTAGLWASSYMVLVRGVDTATAAKMASLFYLGITGGRLISGFVTARLNNRAMVRVGQAIGVAGILLVLLPLGNAMLYAGLTLIGLGCAPIYPALLHETPHNFGREQSQLLMGMQMAAAYTGATLMPPVFGLLAQAVSVQLYPVYLMALMVLMAVMTEEATRVFKKRALKPEA